VPLQRLVEKRAVGLLLHQRQHGAQGGADVAVDRQVEWRAPSETAEVVIDLHRAAPGQERIVGKVRAEREQHVGLVRRLVTGAVPQQPAHPDVTLDRAP
jgi:hypothetical protein